MALAFAENGEFAIVRSNQKLDTPPAEAGGFFLQPEPPATTKAAAGLTLSPEAITASPAAKTF